MKIYSGHGGTSPLRFARQRREKRHNYVRKVAEVAKQMFISPDRVIIDGLILAGSADFRSELSESDLFDQVNYFVSSYFAWRLYNVLIYILEITEQNHQNCGNFLRWRERFQSSH